MIEDIEVGTAKSSQKPLCKGSLFSIALLQHGTLRSVWSEKKCMPGRLLKRRQQAQNPIQDSVSVLRQIFNCRLKPDFSVRV